MHIRNSLNWIASAFKCILANWNMKLTHYLQIIHKQYIYD